MDITLKSLIKTNHIKSANILVFGPYNSANTDLTQSMLKIIFGADIDVSQKDLDFYYFENAKKDIVKF